MLSDKQFDYIESVRKSFLDFQEKNKDISDECEEELKACAKLKSESGQYILSIQDEKGYIRRTIKELRSFKNVSSTCVKKLTGIDTSKEEERWLVLFTDGKLENFYTILLEEIEIFKEVVLGENKYDRKREELSSKTSVWTRV